jgi:hypothetical protein
VNKAESLKAHLMASVRELRHHPDCLRVFLDAGTIRRTGTNSLSFEYGYTLNVMLLEFPGHPDAVAIPLLAWVMENQRDLMDNPERAKTAITFEADILDSNKVDLSIKLPVTEAVIVKRQDNGTLLVTHPDEPQLEPFLPAGTWSLYANGDSEPLAEWESTAQDGVDLAMPHPVPRGR